MGWYVEVLANYANFSGRARRSEYWWFALINFVITILLAFGEAASDGPGLITSLYMLATFIPSLAVAVRRLHDTNRSGWWLLLGIVPFGGLVLLIFFLMGGTQGDNRFGPDPKTNLPGGNRVARTRTAAREEELMKLYELYKSGTLPRDEYETRRRALLSRY